MLGRQDFPWKAVIACLPILVSTSFAKDVDLPPEAGLYYFPNYPREYLIEGIRGAVEARYLVDASGRVETVRILAASQPAFAESVKTALADWRFWPAEKEGKPTASWLQQKFLFQPTRQSYYSVEPVSSALRERRPIPWTGYRPVYPQALKADRVIGHADVIITVRADGRVKKTELESATHPDFRQPALHAASQWKFYPVDPNKLYMEEHGKRPAYLSPDYGTVNLRLTFLFHPDAPPGGTHSEFPGQVSDTLKARKRR
jgi:TonB family protein